MMKPFFFQPCLLIVSCLPLLPVAWTFSAGAYDPHSSKLQTPSEFVKGVIVPWTNRAVQHMGYDSNLNDLSPKFEKAALRYERELGIPQRFIREWACYMWDINQYGDTYDRELRKVAAWGTNESVSIEGGDFDVLSTYCYWVHKRIRERKETLLRTIESSKKLSLPPELDGLSREELLESHEHDELLQQSFANQFMKEECYCVDWFVSIGDLRKLHYFPSIGDLRTDFYCYFPQLDSRKKNIDGALSKIFEIDKPHYATQKHLVKHLAEWRVNLDLIPELYKEVVEPLKLRDIDDKFLTKGAMELGPKELVSHEREEILDFPFHGLEDLDDTSMVKVLRTKREVQDANAELNITARYYDLLYTGSKLGFLRIVAVQLRNQQGTPVAVAEFTFEHFARSGFTASLGDGSSVTIRKQDSDETLSDNEKEEPMDDDLFEICKHYYTDFLFQKVEEDNKSFRQFLQELNLSLE